jgi:hypothetical protein
MSSPELLTQGEDGSAGSGREGGAPKSALCAESIQSSIGGSTAHLARLSVARRAWSQWRWTGGCGGFHPSPRAVPLGPLSRRVPKGATPPLFRPGAQPERPPSSCPPRPLCTGEWPGGLLPAEFNGYERFHWRGRWMAGVKGVINVRVREVFSGQPIGKPLPHSQPVALFTFPPVDNRIATDEYGGTACIWDAEAGKPIGDPLRARMPRCRCCGSTRQGSG